MVDFSNAQINPVPSAMTPPQPVADTGDIVATQAIAQGLSNAGTILGNVLTKHKQTQQATAHGNVLARFTEDLGRIDNALQQGEH